MRKILLGLMLLLTACSVPHTHQYFGIASMSLQGKVVASQVIMVSDTKEGCETFMKNWASDAGELPIGVTATIACPEIVPVQTFTGSAATSKEPAPKLPKTTSI